MCNKIRDDASGEHSEGEWLSLPVYMSKEAKIDVSHGYCHECFKDAERMIDKQIKQV